MATTIIIGVGNPVIADDALGLVAARCIRKRLPMASWLTVAEIHNGGLELMEAMVGYDHAFVVDAIVTGGRPGTIYRLEVDQLAATRNACTSHSGTLSSALELGRLSGVKLPRDVRIWAVEADDVATFCESLTAEVEAAVADVVSEIVRELSPPSPCSRRLVQ